MILKLNNKRLILVKNVDMNKILLSNKVSFSKKGFKYFMGYTDAEEMCISLKNESIKKVFWQNSIYVFFDKRWWVIRKI